MYLVDDKSKKIVHEYFYKVPIENGEFRGKSFIIICNDNMRENMKKNSVIFFILIARISAYLLHLINIAY